MVQHSFAEAMAGKRCWVLGMRYSVMYAFVSFWNEKAEHAFASPPGKYIVLR